MRHDAETLRAEIDAAFAEREHPGDDCVAYIQKGCCEAYEGYQAQEWLRGKTRQDLVAEGMRREHHDFLHFLRPKGWLFYFSTFATFSLDPDHPAEMHEALLFKIAWYPQEFAPFLTLPERRAVVHFLEYLADVYDERGWGNQAQYALDTYWGRFSDKLAGKMTSRQEWSSQSPAALRQELASAFKREYPGDDQLASLKGWERTVTHEGNEARDWLRGKTWEQVLEEGVEDKILIPFLTVEGWLYFFPAFAILALDIDDPADLATILIFRLWTSPEEISARLLPRERLAIVHWLEYLADAFEKRGRVLNDAARALDDYWAYFLDEELYGDDESTTHAPGGR